MLGDEDPQSLLESTIKKVEDNEKIHVLTGANIKDVEGCIGHFRTKISVHDEERELEHGIVIVATGAVDYEPNEYFYGNDERVLTQSELECKLVKGDFSADRVVMIQCIGSRDEERPYCSRTCCGDAIKNALKIKDLSPETEVYVIFKDIRTYGFKEKYYKEAAEKGVVFIRYDDDSKPVVDNKDGLRVSVRDLILDRDITLKSDMLVLSTGMIPRDDTKDIAQLLKLPTTKDGFFLEAHMKLRPVDFATDGVFLCGKAHAPKYVEECISQASAAAARASTILSKETLESEAVISKVNEELCSGCGVCVEMCPYSAIDLVERTVSANERDALFDAIVHMAEVNPALCRGCGSCTGACPSGAMGQSGFRDDQVYAMINAFLKKDVIEVE
jgi:heterodisulfide reductase subunit A